MPLKLEGEKNWQLQNLASIYSEIWSCLKHSCWKILHMHLRVIRLCRCFWSARVPSDRVPSGRPDQTDDGPEQGWSGGLHKLLPACAQVGSTLTCWFQMGFKNGLTWTCCFGSKKLEKECMVSVVADLRHASLPTVRFITETLLLLEVLVPAGAAADLCNFYLFWSVKTDEQWHVF